MKVKSHYLILILFMLLAFFMFYGNLETQHFLPKFFDYENKLQDTMLQWKQEKIDSRIAIIAIDDQSLNDLGAWPWSRGYHAQLIDMLSQSKAAAIAFDIEFFGNSEDPDADAALAEMAGSAGNVIVASQGEFGSSTKAGQLAAQQYFEPFDALKSAASVGHINVIPDNDGIVRYFLSNFTYKDPASGSTRNIDCFDLQVLRQYYKSIGKPCPVLNLPKDAWNRVYIDYAGGPGSYEVIPYSQLLDGTVSADILKDKIVLVGPYTVGMTDTFYTSIDKTAPMYGVEIHANIIQALLHKDFKRFTAFPLNLLILAAFGLAGYFACKKLPPVLSLAVTAAASALYIFIARLVYINDYILTILYPLAFIFSIYFIMLAYRYIEELLERRRITGIFGRYVAPQVVSQILKGGEEGLQLGGARREISALFVDIRGFTPMSEKAQPEEVVNILNDYLDLCARSIFQYGGTLDKFIGDATMAIFNAPLDLEEHALMAVKTAWAMKQGSVALQQKLEEKYGRSVQFGIGVNTGPAVVGNIGSRTRMDYTAIGDTVNTAARLESNAKPGQILLSQATYDLVKDKIKATFLGEINVKGKTQGITVYQMEGVVE